jgi:GntR family transcriptional regulator / MocR family aminotransferase
MAEERGPVWGLDLLVAIERRAASRGAAGVGAPSGGAGEGAGGEAGGGAGGVPIHEQLEQALRQSIRSGRLPAGSRLPSSRSLAARLRVSRGVVSEAYGQLAAEGYLTSRQGAAVRVSSAVRALERPSPARSLMPRFSYDLRPSLPDLASFPRDRWQRSIRAALRESPLSAIGYPDPRGVPELRAALSDYLARVRGAAADPEHLLVCTGFMQGLSLLCRALAAQGVASIALEDPGWHTHRLIAEQCGLQVEPVQVDADGIDVQALTGTDASVVLVTPSHQFPTGVTLSPRRRAALIEWAESGERLIVEDDYDGELRFDRGAVGALQGLAPERVVYAGSASKRLAPAMRLGWLLTPSWITWSLSAAKATEDGGSEAIGQLALAHFIAHGELDRHLRRMRSTYERRRQALLGALARRLPQARATGSPCGLFEPVLLPAGVDEPALLSAAASRGLGLEGISLHRFKAGGEPCLLLGYGGLAEPAIERGVDLLVEAFAQLDDG